MPESPEQLRARLRAEIAAIEKGVPKPSRAPDLPHVREEREDRRPSRASRSLSASAAGGQPSRHDAGEVDEDVRLSDPDAAFRKIERLCLVRERASEQLRQRLARGGFEAEAVEAALDRALACGLVDDGRFADVLVRSRLAQGRGRRGIAAELESLGIDADSVEALAAADDDAGEVD
ncbi:MAG: regulatory protein RecX, partial [Eggerthella lenta]